MTLPPEQEAIRAKCFHPSGTFVEFPIEDVESSIPARFEKIVGLYPEFTAIKTGEQVVTYRELNATANRIARVVAARRGDCTMPVALLFEKGVAQIAAMLGVLKAGRFFVLLDSSLPKSRLEVILEDCSPDLTITNRQNLLLANELMPDGQPVIELESVDDRLALDNLYQKILPDAIAFVVHTSGSSGRPKGVVNNHRVVLHHLMLRSNADKFCVQDRIPLLTSGTSNTITTSLGALLNGAALLPFDVNKGEGGGLSRWLAREKITILPIATPLFRNLCEVLTEADRFSDIRLLRLGSDSVRKPDIDLYKRFFSDYSSLVNGLNSGETHMLAEYLIERDTKFPGDDVPVGYAARDKEIVLLNEQGDPVGYNEIGEIVVRSKYLSPGYWRDPELTAAKFKIDPEHSDQRIYYTGDLGLMLADGCLIHKGRKDFRVKIRGYGVEIGEVEKTLREQVGIQDAVVVAKVKDSGEARLVAYLTSQVNPSTTEIRHLLQTKLPEYMIPSTFVFLDTLPFTANGKVDRRALPDPDSRRPGLDTPFVAPRTDLENTIARIFSECIGIEPVGIEDNFFELGGDSLTLGRVMTRLTATFEREIPMANLFASPSVAGVARLLEATAQSSAPANETAMCSVSSDPPLELSFSQQRLWFLDQLHPGDPAYNLLAAFQIAGKLNISALEQSLNEIIARHEVLRTVFESVDGKPSLKVLANLAISLHIVDLGERKSVLEDEAVLGRYCAALARQPFDLSCGPLLRVSLLRRSNDDYILLFAVHHIVFDGWSMGVLWSELADCYEAFCEGRQVALPKLAIQYADYARWQRDRLQNHLLQKQLEYWRRHLDGMTPLQLLTDWPRPRVQSSRGAKQCFTLSLDLSAKLKRLSYDRGATLFMTLMAAFQTLLHRYTAQDDIAIGCPVAGRNCAEVENLIGIFLNILVFRVDTSGAPSFLELLNRVRQVCLAAYAHQDLPFEKLVEELHPERQLNRSPIVDVAFAFQNTPRVPLVLSGTSVSPLDLDSGISRFDLQLFLEESAGQLRGNFSYNTDLFDERTIARMAEHLLNLIESIVADPDQPIDRLALLGEPERWQLLNGWNNTERNYPTDLCIHQLFEQQVALSPDAVALVFENKQLTYRDLNSIANQLAHYLRKRGVKPEILVAVCMERSLEMVIAILGILKAGGAYVPMDPEYPKDRLDFMLGDTQAPVLVIQERLSQILPAYQGLRVCLDRDRDQIARESEENLSQDTSPDSLAYVIYTSGSTGKPKGVMIQHGSVINFLNSMAVEPGLTNRDTLLAVTTLSFDIAALEIFLPLLVGAQIVLVSRAIAMDGFQLAKQLSDCGATIMQATPATWHMLLASGWQGSPRLKILCGGEALPRELADPLLCRSASLWNMYGPTETTVWSAVQRVAGNDAKICLGRPIANTQLYILDQKLQPVPIGVTGELHIGGAGLARGYLNRAELTEEKFIADPFSTVPGARLYRTGDRTRYLADGSIEFLGRIDTQVKLRGYRIELGEVEAMLGQHRAVRSSAVAGREDAQGDKRLVGYVVTRRGESFDAAEVRRYLNQKLPEYMIPSALVRLDALPLTPNGKVDRKALPAPDQSRRELENAYQGPRTATEETLAAIWREVLKLDKVGIHDNFFNLGGHSLLAAQVVSRIRSTFSIDFPLRRLFESPTVVEIAVVITENQANRATDVEVEQILREVEATTEQDARKLLGI